MRPAKEAADTSRLVLSPMPGLLTQVVVDEARAGMLLIAEHPGGGGLLCGIGGQGLGVQPPTPSWGYMLQESIAFSFAWKDMWLPTLPGLMIFITTLSINFVGDGLREVMDPRERAAL